MLGLVKPDATTGASIEVDHVAEVFALVQTGGIPMAIATADATGRPTCLRGLGVDVGEDCAITVFVNAALAGRIRADLEVSPRIAVTFSRLPDLRSVQLKGVVRHVRPTTAREQELQARYMAAFTELLAAAGIPRSLTRGIVAQPSLAIELEAREIFDQTPGRGAGRRLGVPP